MVVCSAYLNTHTDYQDLILIPFDASFVKVSQSSGRVYVLKFSSSNQRHFVSFSGTG